MNTILDTRIFVRPSRLIFFGEKKKYFWNFQIFWTNFFLKKVLSFETFKLKRKIVSDIFKFCMESCISSNLGTLKMIVLAINLLIILLDQYHKTANRNEKDCKLFIHFFFKYIFSRIKMFIWVDLFCSYLLKLLCMFISIVQIPFKGM